MQEVHFFSLIKTLSNLYLQTDITRNFLSQNHEKIVYFQL